MDAETMKLSVRNFLAAHHMKVDDEWLTGCVEFLTEEGDNRFSETEIQNLAKEQWLLNDLKEICPGCLPDNLKSQQKTTLTGRYTLQINAAIDIGTPAYQQYLKLQKVNMENIEATTNYEDKIPSHRMIKLYLTDGVQEVSAIEYKPMRNLSVDITPGCKALIKGPVDCRRGVLLLKEANIELLGGEVQEIAISNSLASLLSTKLGLPMPQESVTNRILNHPRNSNIPTPSTTLPSRSDLNSERLTSEESRSCNIQRPNETTRPNELSRPTEHRFNENSRPVARVAGIPITATIEDDIDIDIDQIAAIEAQLENPNKRPSVETNSNSEKRVKIDRNNIDDYPNDDDLFLEDDDHLREMEANFDLTENVASNVQRKPVKVSAEPFVYIKQINDLTDREKAGKVFRVKAQIMKLLSKLSVGKDGWSLRCTLVDGSGSIDAEFTSAVLSKLVGFTPQEMNHLKKQMATKPELKQKAVSALQKAKDTLQVLYCIIELTMLEVPKITCIIPFQHEHVEYLKKRKQNCVL